MLQITLSADHPTPLVDQIVAAVRTRIPAVSIEVGPMETSEYCPMTASGAEGLVVYQETYKNEFSNARVALALDAVRDAGGNIVCRSGAVGCVPYNIWALGQINPAALAYIQTPGFQKGTTEQKILGLCD